jgi:C4-type Zn-finger protein
MPTSSSIEIYCPRCQWEPDGGAHWRCHCGHIWNTFDTAAVCPHCRYRHRDTSCPAQPGGCGQVSPHIDWYHGLSEAITKMVEEALTTPVGVCCMVNES